MIQELKGLANGDGQTMNWLLSRRVDALTKSRKFGYDGDGGFGNDGYRGRWWIRKKGCSIWWIWLWTDLLSVGGDDKGAGEKARGTSVIHGRLVRSQPLNEKIEDRDIPSCKPIVNLCDEQGQ